MEDDRSIPREVAEAAARVRHWLRSQSPGTAIEGMVMISDRPRPGVGMMFWGDFAAVYVDHSVSATFRSGVLESVAVCDYDLWRRGVGVDPEVVERAIDRITADARCDLRAREMEIREEASRDQALLAA